MFTDRYGIVEKGILMIFAGKSSYGFTDGIFLNEYHIGYLNLCKVVTKIGLTIGNATSIDKDKQICMKKCFSEYLERFALGIPIQKNILIKSVNVIKDDISDNEFTAFGYGDSEFGHNDTTGTATGLYSQKIIDKAVRELLEKNEVLCFWYGNCGRKIVLNNDIVNIINNYNFIADDFYCFVVNELSNVPTIIVLGFKNKRLLTSGVSCDYNIVESLNNALGEAKTIEWQQYNNNCSALNNYTNKEQQKIMSCIMQKNKEYDSVCISELESINGGMQINDWIDDIRWKILYSDDKLGLKTVKCISKHLMSSIPIKENIKKCEKKEIIKKYYIYKEVDCPIV